ncbi:MAG: PilZ domain-containing protein [Desulfatiglandales bacterium]
MKTKKERREFQRAEIDWPVNVESDQVSIEGKLKNIGVNGAFIDCEQISEPGERVTVTVFIPNHAPMQIIAEVVWTCMAFPHGIGVQFVKISQEDSQLLSKAILELPKAKSDEEALWEV